MTRRPPKVPVMSPRRKYLLFPQRADPRNRTCAALSGPILALELLVVFLLMGIPPVFAAGSELLSRLLWMFLFVVPTILIVVGARGLASDREERFASGCLVVVNLLLLSGVVYFYVLMAHRPEPGRAFPFRPAGVASSNPRTCRTAMIADPHLAHRSSATSTTPLIDEIPNPMTRFLAAFLVLVLAGCASTPKPSAGGRLFSELRAGERLHVRYASNGCFHRYAYGFEFERSTAMTVRIASLSPTWSWSLAPEDDRPPTPLGTLTLSRRDVSGLDRLLRAYRASPGASSTTIDNIMLERFNAGDVVTHRESFLNSAPAVEKVFGVTTLPSLVRRLEK